MTFSRKVVNYSRLVTFPVHHRQPWLIKSRRGMDELLTEEEMRDGWGNGEQLTAIMNATCQKRRAALFPEQRFDSEETI